MLMIKIKTFDHVGEFGLSQVSSLYVKLATSQWIKGMHSSQTSFPLAADLTVLRRFW
jgi:hypothetical protein